MKKAAGYLRRSGTKQEKSIPDQKKAILAYALMHGFEIVRWYIDDAITGTSTKRRNDFKQMIVDASRPDCEFELILVYDVKRFGRGDTDEAGYYRYLLRQHGVEVVYVSENFRGDENDDMIRVVKQIQARQEVRDLSKVTFRGLISSAERGYWLGGVPPFGFDLRYESSAGVLLMTVRYLNDGRKEVYGTDGKLVRVLRHGEPAPVSKTDRATLVLSAEDRVELVRRIFNMYTREGMGLGAITEALNRAGIPSPGNCNSSKHSGRFWSKGTLRFILKNPRYAGDMVWNRRASGKFHRVREKEARERPGNEFEKFCLNGEKDWIVVPNSHPAIVDKATFEEAQRLMKDRNRKHGAGPAFRSGRAKHSRYLLSGVMRCARCGHPYTGYPAASSKRRKNGEKIVTYYYACSAYVNKGNAVCTRHLVGLEEIHKYVLSRIGLRVERFLSAGGREILRKMVAKELGATRKEPQQEAKEIRHQLGMIEADLSRLVKSLTPENTKFVDPELQKLGKEKDEFEARLRKVEVVPDEQVNPDKLAEQIVRGLKSFGELFEQGTQEERKEFVRAFVEQLVVDPDRGKGTLYIREFPALESIRAGNSSFEMVAGARYEPATASSGES